MVDGVSWRILLEDLEQAYKELERGESVRLRAKTSSFQQWAQRLTERAKSAEVEGEAGYWLEERRQAVKPLKVKGAEAANLAGRAEKQIAENLVGEAGRVFKALSEEQTASLLREATATYRARIDELLLGALAEAFRRWRQERLLLVEVEGHGRELDEPVAAEQGAAPTIAEMSEAEAIGEERSAGKESSGELDVTRTVGWFTTLYPLLLEARAGQWPVEVIRRVKQEVRGVPGRGLGYGLLRYLGTEEIAVQLREMPQAEVSFNYLGQVDEAVSEKHMWRAAKEKSGRVRSERAVRRHIISIDSSISAGQLRVAWSFSRNAYSQEQIEALAEAYMKALGEAVEQCRKGAAATVGYTPSDFPDAHLSQQELKRLLSRANLTNKRSSG
jgi:non-ribosomal peptide synthase protein (TIGR01720 family)